MVRKTTAGRLRSLPEGRSGASQLGKSLSVRPLSTQAAGSRTLRAPPRPRPPGARRQQVLGQMLGLSWRGLLGELPPTPLQARKVRPREGLCPAQGHTAVAESANPALSLQKLGQCLPHPPVARLSGRTLCDSLPSVCGDRPRLGSRCSCRGCFRANQRNNFWKISKVLHHKVAEGTKTSSSPQHRDPSSGFFFLRMGRCTDVEGWPCRDRLGCVSPSICVCRPARTEAAPTDFPASSCPLSLAPTWSEEPSARSLPPVCAEPGSRRPDGLPHLGEPGVSAPLGAYRIRFLPAGTCSPDLRRALTRPSGFASELLRGDPAVPAGRSSRD